MFRLMEIELQILNSLRGATNLILVMRTCQWLTPIGALYGYVDGLCE